MVQYMLNMITGAESEMLCPRTGIPCPLLIDCVTLEQASLASIAAAEGRYLAAVEATAVNNVELELYTETFSSDEGGVLREDILVLLAKRKEAGERFEESLIKVTQARETIVNNSRNMARYARNTCIGGPFAPRRYILLGEKTLKCSSLAAIIMKD